MTSVRIKGYWTLRRDFRVVATRVWNVLPHHVTSTPFRSTVFSGSRLKIFNRFVLDLLWCMSTDFSHYQTYTLIAFVTLLNFTLLTYLLTTNML